MRRPVISKNREPPPRTRTDIYVPRHLRHLIFPPGHIYHPPPPPPPKPKPKPPPPPPSSSYSSSSSTVIVPHSLFQGVYVSNLDGNTLFTKNLAPALPPCYHDERILSVKDDIDGSVVEYREWNPVRSKLAAAILCGAENIWIKPGSRVLVMYSRDDEQFGITISHISDLVGPGGMVYVVEPYYWKTLANMADKRFNIVPIIHFGTPDRYRMLINMVDVLFAAPNLPEQFQCAYLNVKYFLKTGGHYMLYLQADCIESTSHGEAAFCSVGKSIEFEFKRMQQVILEPFDRKHAYVIGTFRMLEMVDPICLVTNEFWTAPIPDRPIGRPLTIYEKHKDLPVYMLFESSCGYALLRAHDVFKVERNYVAIEEYINRYDEVFELIAYQPFETVDDALVYLNNVCCNETVHEQLINFLVRNLPPPKEGDNHCYSLALFTGFMAYNILNRTKIACLASLFHVEIIRGVRMHIDKFIKNMKPGDLEKAQVELARNYCRQKLISPDKG